MSFRLGKHLTLSGIDYSGKSPEQVQNLFRQILEGAIAYEQEELTTVGNASSILQDPTDLNNLVGKAI
jgi:hypothetical protein